MQLFDYFALSFTLGLLFWHEKLFHAPNSVHVVNAIFRSGAHDCYVLRPIVVQCDQ